MRYGKPSINENLNFYFKKVVPLLILPLYPQYSASTTASVQDEVFKWLLKKRWQPSIRTIAPWFDDDKYITNIANSIKESFKKTGKPEHLIVSFHGVPVDIYY